MLETSDWPISHERLHHIEEVPFGNVSSILDSIRKGDVMFSISLKEHLLSDSFSSRIKTNIFIALQWGFYTKSRSSVSVSWQRSWSSSECSYWCLLGPTSKEFDCWTTSMLGWGLPSQFLTYCDTELFLWFGKNQGIIIYIEKLDLEPNQRLQYLRTLIDTVLEGLPKKTPGSANFQS